MKYQAPFDFAALLEFFARRAIPGIEIIDADSYSRCFALNGDVGSLRVAQATRAHALELSVDFPDHAQLHEIETRVRRMFDVDADIGAIYTRLSRKPPLRRQVARNPGQRVPGAWDGFEIAVRAVLGQQVSVAAARTLCARLVQQFGALGKFAQNEEIHLFPNPVDLLDADLTAIGVTRARAQTLREMARAICDGRVDFNDEQPLEQFVERWTALPGIGPWTAHYIAMRALRHADAFPAADLVLRKAASRNGSPLTTAKLQALAEDWRPYRAYAVLHLWRSVG
ncbi:MAG TPA: DNA-3-methyladenine glycosylase [Rudaea sp.]|nr:DNA-3-methyladenine glycosylase [Rudaea sp.]